MLRSLYAGLFHPAEIPLGLSLGQAWGIWALLSLLEAFLLGGALGVGGGGVAALAVLLFGLNSLAWYWFSASANLLAEAMGGSGRGSELLVAVAQAFWPMLLIAPIRAAAPWIGPLSGLLSLLVVIWVVLCLVRMVARTHRLSTAQAGLVVVGSGVAGFLGLISLMLLPVLALVLAVLA